MQKFIFTMIFSAMFSQGVMAMQKDELDVDHLIATAHAQGYAVAHCVKSMCHDTDNGHFVSIDDSERDGYYVYDPRSADAPENFTLSPQH